MLIWKQAKSLGKPRKKRSQKVSMRHQTVEWNGFLSYFGTRKSSLQAAKKSDYSPRPKPYSRTLSRLVNRKGKNVNFHHPYHMKYFSFRNHTDHVYTGLLAFMCKDSILSHFKRSCTYYGQKNSPAFFRMSLLSLLLLFLSVCLYAQRAA
jgi:hypothetical protein